MSVTASVIPELDEVIRNGSPDRRAAMVRSVSAFFLEGPSRLNDAQVKVFDHVLSRLISAVETRPRAELSQRLASVTNAPLEVVRQLARDDDIEVARPVLEKSTRIPENDLVPIARTKSQSHLLAIAARPKIAAPVADILVRRGDHKVARALAENHGACLTTDSFRRLVGMAETDQQLAEKLATRPDLPPHLRPELVLEATEAVQQRLLVSADAGTETATRRLAGHRADDIHACAARDYAPARQRTDRLRQEHRLDEKAIFELAKGRRFEDTVVAIACICVVPIEVVEQILGCDRPDPVLILCRAAGWGWPTAKEIISIRPTRQPDTSQSLDAAHANFENLSPSTAKRVMRFWQVQATGDGRQWIR